MSKIKSALEKMSNCSECEGSGIVNAWASPDGDFDFDWCDCNPHHLTIEY